MKLLQGSLILSEILFILLVIFPSMVESRPFAQAIAAYSQDPSSRNKSELERQRAIVDDTRFRHNLFIIGLLAANSLGLFVVARRNRLDERTPS
jgi:hypothetical protein